MALALGLTFLAGLGVMRLEVRSDLESLLPDDEVVARDRRIRRLFHLEDSVVLVVRSHLPGGIYHTDGLRRLAQVTRLAASVPGVSASDVVSLATEPSGRRAAGTLRFPPFLDPFPASFADRQRLRRDVEEMGLFLGKLVSRDGRSPTAAVVLVGLAPGADRRRAVEGLEVLAARASTPGVEVFPIGFPVAEALLGRHILSDLLRLAPLCALVILLVFLVVFGRLAAAILPGVEAVAAAGFVLGTAGWLGIPITLPLTVLPVVVLTLGVIDEVHVLSRYRRESSSGGEDARREVVSRTMVAMAGPIYRTSVTTAVALLSFSVAPLASLRDFSALATLGTLFCMAWSLLVTPALLVIVPHRWLDSRRRSRTAVRLPERFSARGVWVSLSFLALLIAGSWRLRVDDGWHSAFAESSQFRRRLTAAAALFDGSHLLRVVFDTRGAAPSATAPIPLPETTTAGEFLPLDGGSTGKSSAAAPFREAATARGRPLVLWLGTGRPPQRDVLRRPAGRFVSGEWWATPDSRRLARLAETAEVEPVWQDGAELWPTSALLLDPEVLDLLVGLEDRAAAAIGDAGGVLRASEQVMTTRLITHGRRSGERRLGSTATENRDLMYLLGVVRGDERRREVIDDAAEQACFTVFLRAPTYAQVERLLAAIEDYSDQVLNAAGIRVWTAGDVALSQRMIDVTVRSQARSIVLAFLLVLTVLTFFERSFRRGAICSLPVAVAVSGSFGIMGWAGVPLGVATSMFTTMLVGVGVDFAVHLSAAQSAEELAPASAPASSVLPAITASAAALAAGFGILMFSSVPSNVRFGLLSASGVLLSAVAAALLVPPLLDSTARTGGPR